MATANSHHYLIHFLGADWWGSDARALAVALRKSGHTLIETNYEDYFPQWSSVPLKIVRRLIRPWCAQNFNEGVLQHTENNAIDFLLVFKGMMLAPQTLAAFRKRRVPIYCFYPDVSFLSHGANIWNCLPHYSCVFTTKSFHMESAELRQRVRDLRLVMHGFDPEVHRPVQVSDRACEYYGCDVSFVGCWSSKKERLIAALVAGVPDYQIKVWGPGWERAGSAVRQRWMGRGAYGDELAIIYQTSHINLGLLSEAGQGTSSGDRTTVRTWQIPAAGGFLLHEATAEFAGHFIPGSEVATFEGETDLPHQVKKYLSDSKTRFKIALAGHRRCLASRYTYNSAAEAICSYHEAQTLP